MANSTLRDNCQMEISQDRQIKIRIMSRTTLYFNSVVLCRDRNRHNTLFKQLVS